MRPTLARTANGHLQPGPAGSRNWPTSVLQSDQVVAFAPNRSENLPSLTERQAPGDQRASKGRSFETDSQRSRVKAERKRTADRGKSEGRFLWVLLRLSKCRGRTSSSELHGHMKVQLNRKHTSDIEHIVRHEGRQRHGYTHSQWPEKPWLAFISLYARTVNGGEERAHKHGHGREQGTPARVRMARATSGSRTPSCQVAGCAC